MRPSSSNAPAIFLRLCFLCFLLALTSARADLMVPMPIEDMANRAKLIIHGTVLSTTVLRDDAGEIYTRVELQVDEVWKGSLNTNRFSIVLGGGILGDEGVSISGQVQYDVGEEVVAFVVFNSKGEGVTLGLSQGKFHVWADPATGEKLARNHFHGRHYSSPNPNRPATALPANIHPPPTIINRLTLADLKARCAGGGK